MPVAGERDQPTGLDRFAGHGRTDPARVCQIQQHRGAEDFLPAGTVEPGLRGRVVQQQQEQVFGDLRHFPDCSASTRAVPSGVVRLGADQGDLDGVAVGHGVGARLADLGVDQCTAQR